MKARAEDLGTMTYEQYLEGLKVPHLKEEKS